MRKGREMKSNRFEGGSNNNNSNGIGSGFLLGLLLGVLVTLLITTKKGREILRDLMDRIINKIAELDGSIERVKQEFTTAADKTSSDNNSDYIKQETNIVKEEIKAANSSLPVKKPASNHEHKKVEKVEKVEKKEVDEKAGNQGKNIKRLFFRRSVSK
jgi:gas vesicle protein